MAQVWREVLLRLLPTEHGGRSAPLDLCNDDPGRYQADLRLVGSSVKFAVAFMDGPDTPVDPGEETYATVKFLDETAGSQLDLSPGTRFELLEGSQVVGTGRITRQ